MNAIDLEGFGLADAGIGALVGVVTGGLIGLLNGTGFWHGVVSGAVGGLVTGWTSGLVAEGFDSANPFNSFSWGDIDNSTLFGAVFGMGLGPVGKLNAPSVAQ